jgi:hypothetical protein
MQPQQDLDTSHPAYGQTPYWVIKITYFLMMSEMNMINKNKNADVFSSHILKLQ